MIQGYDKERLTVVWFAAALGGVVLALRLVQLQIVQHIEYQRAAERNRTQMIYQNAPRGKIYDRNGTAIATNRPAFSLIYLPGKKGAQDDLKPLAKELARQLNEEEAPLLETLQQAVREESAIRLAENLPPQTMFRLSELKTIYPGVDLIIEARRYYPFGAFASHLLGYMGKMDPNSWKTLKKKGYRVDSRIGKLGLESRFEEELRGLDGGIRMEVDAQGRLKRMLEKMDWQAGSNLHLTVDADTQKAADEALRKSTTGRGAVVAVDPRSGAILAMSSAPDFDPNSLLAYEASDVNKTMSTLPEFNRAISGAYAPGSTFKPIVSAAGFEEGKISPDDTVFCPGHFELGKKTFLCWEHQGHGRVAFLWGLAKSCDVYYYRTGLRIGGGLVEKYARIFRLGKKTDVALKGEVAGHMFGPESRKASGRDWWYDGDTVNQSIGQGELTATPIQMANVAAVLANRGSFWRPHYVDYIEYADGRPEFHNKPEKIAQITFKPSTWKMIDDAMRLVVTSGTAHQAIIQGLYTRGKTGTAQNPHGKDHAWFIAWASKDTVEPPSIAMAILIENGGHGSDAAVPVARKVFEAWFRVQPEGQKKPKPAVPRVPAPAPKPLMTAPGAGR